jgi:multidrug efflux pump subunit AcrA (membrane-fusion protein)
MNASVPLRLAPVRSIAAGVLPGVLLGAAFAASAGGAVTAAEAAPAAPAQIAQVTVVRAANACFSASIRVTGFLVPREQAVLTLDAPGLRVTEVLAGEGDKVTAGQTLVRLARAAADAPEAASARNITALRAPAAGVVTRSTAVVGATAPAGPSEPLFQIAIDGEIELEAEVPSIHVPELASGQAARVEVEGRELSGRLRLVPAAIDRRTQLGRARISLERDPTLRVGTFARATIEASRSCGVSVPGSAVLYRTGGASVLVVRDDVVETRLVQVGLHSDTETEIREGLHLGDLVIANAGSSLRDGDKVRPVVSDTAR